MIVWINGAFGVGKTTVAERLVARLPNSFLYDPELVGSFLRKVIHPLPQPEDYQDLPMWRALVVATARGLREMHGKPLVVPMTLYHPPYCDEVLGGMRELDPDFHHVCLIGSAATIRERLRQRGEGPGSFAWERVERCVAAFPAPRFAPHIPTDGCTPDEVTAAVLAHLPAAPVANGRAHG